MGADLSFFKADANGENEEEFAYFRNYMPLNVASFVVRGMHYPEGDERAQDYDNIDHEEIFLDDLPLLLEMAGITEIICYSDQSKKVKKFLEDIQNAFASGQRVFVDCSL